MAVSMWLKFTISRRHSELCTMRSHIVITLWQLSRWDTFVNIKGGFYNGQRDVYFVRALGETDDIVSVISAIDRKMDAAAEVKQLFYRRIRELPRLLNMEDSEFYAKAYADWINNGVVRLKTAISNYQLLSVISAATQKTVETFKTARTSTTETIVRSFVVKLWFWLDQELVEILPQWTERLSVKIIAINVTKTQDYLFFYMITLLGCDVLLLNTKVDIKTEKRIMLLSCTLKLGPYNKTEIPDYQPPVQRTVVNSIVPQKKIADRVQPSIPLVGTTRIQEKSFEDLAMLASSIVLIEVLDSHIEPVATGSGIMIGKKGFIFTNCHVVQAGRAFAVRIEDDEEVYVTNEIIKYNTQLDLAIIRIRKELNPLHIYDGKRKLVRGQKVVAIGSPLGLFNSVSDGIISGFRNIRNMIQFTAPISHGSSGGAVLNMYGDVIGISTAGIDSGQNINLAVSYEDIRMFAKGFY